MAHNSNKEFAFKSIRELVESGITVLKENTSNCDAERRWLDYSAKIVELSTRNFDSSIYLNYLRLLTRLLIQPNITDRDKISKCLDYLLEVLRIMVDGWPVGANSTKR